MLAAKQAREQAGLSLQQVTKRARVCTAYLRRIECGAIIPPYSLATRLSRLYNCNIAVFLGSTKQGNKGIRGNKN